MQSNRITIIGLGNVGLTLNKALPKAGYSIHGLYSRNKGAHPNVIDRLPRTSEELGDILFITVSDSALKDVVDELSQRDLNFEGVTVLHCSGNENSELLQPFKDVGASVGAFHPMKAILKGQDSFEDVYFDIEGDTLAVKRMYELAKKLKAHAFEIPSSAKSLIHAASVMASNYVVTLLNASSEMAELSGVSKDEIEKALLSLTRSSLKNMLDKGIEHSLTGPIARGDLSTIEKHLEDLSVNPKLVELYAKLGLLTIPLAKDVDIDTQRSLKDLFNGKIKD
ncbi:Rossmann-like and DUF2520 domain-containing protein [Balneola vulgaris]|uniref:Rossmann-like and DUF2520 domain-containing protein n=1 Tax=Balneola vulgaris TaxID=287535 RepID=UPI00036780BD|nr:Rossmann-like and DUF2520 domain-containing protein [Balneola vulgaris]